MKGRVIKNWYCGYQVTSKNPNEEEMKLASIEGRDPRFIETEEVITPVLLNLKKTGSGDTDILTVSATAFVGPYAKEKAVSIITTEVREIVLEDFRDFMAKVLQLDPEECFPGFNWSEMFYRLNQNN